eukprot:7384906-Prymnesium_polylepis.1
MLRSARSTPPPRSQNQIYVIDPDGQTDNEVSPWQTHASRSHTFWCSKHPALAKIKFPRVRRSAPPPPPRAQRSRSR